VRRKYPFELFGGGFEMDRAAWAIKLNQYETSDPRKIVWQCVSAFVPYLALMAIMFWSLSQGYSYVFVLALAPWAALFLVKIFMILHECSHKSYLKGSPLGCFILGHICGIFTFTALFDFRQTHVIHHATVANLDKRGIGDITTMTVKEYLAATPWIKFWYRLFRNPLFLFVVAPTLKFVVQQRFPKPIMRTKEVLSVLFTDLILVLILWAAYLTVGLKTYFLVQLPVIAMASSLGVWIFYSNHQFENVYWAHTKDCSRIKAALLGSSFYRFPKLLAWFTDSIEYHHIHHLNFRIPNYNLKKCSQEIPELRAIPPRTLKEGLEAMFLALWDESSGKLISFAALDRRFT